MRFDDRSSWDEAQPRDTMQAVMRGFRCRCPACGEGRMFGKYLKVNPVCDHCGLQMDGHRADDMPPYVVMMIVGHIVLPFYMLAESLGEWSTRAHLAVWPLLSVLMCLALLQPVKGALIGYQWALKMHGFDPERLHRDPALPGALPETR